MPPRKTVAAKQVKGKAKAQDKEEKKQTKVAKTTQKGRSFEPFIKLPLYSLKHLSSI